MSAERHIPTPVHIARTWPRISRTRRVVTRIRACLLWFRSAAAANAKRLIVGAAVRGILPTQIAGWLVGRWLRGA